MDYKESEPLQKAIKALEGCQFRVSIDDLTEDGLPVDLLLSYDSGTYQQGLPFLDTSVKLLEQLGARRIGCNTTQFHNRLVEVAHEFNFGTTRFRIVYKSTITDQPMEVEWQ